MTFTRLYFAAMRRSSSRLPSVEVEVTTGVDAVAMPAGYAREEANHDARLSRGRGVAA